MLNPWTLPAIGRVPDVPPKPIYNAMLRVLLPPNLAAAADRNAIAVKIEIDPSPIPPPLLSALAWLQRQTGPAVKPPLFLQFSRSQLRELVGLAEDQPAFFWVNRPAQPLAWNDGLLPGVSEHLAEPSPSPLSSPPTGLQPPGTPRPKLVAPETSEPLTVDGSEHFLAFTLPTRDHPTYDGALALVKGQGFVLEPSNRRWWLRDRHKTLNFLATNRARLSEEFGARFTPNFERNTARLKIATVTCEAAEVRGGYEVTLALRAGTASEEAVRASLASSRSYVEIAGEIVLLPAAVVEHLAVVQSRLSGEPAGQLSPRRTLRVSRSAAVEADSMLESLAPDFQPPATWRIRSGALRNLSKLEPAHLPPELDACLRLYQRLGAAWLWHLYRHELGGILADEMGLGKTLEALALLAALRFADPPVPGTSLVVCPASLVENWRREAARFTPGMKVIAHHGGSRSDSAAAVLAADLVVTSYGTLVRDQALFQSVEFACVIGDEAQHIKNRRTQHAQALCALRARGRFLLTGTPLENSLDDLRSLFAFLMPGHLSPLPAGVRGEDKTWHDERLRAQTAPYILRRTKSAVAPELPPKIEQIVYCEFPPAQAALYRKWQERGERELDSLASGGASEGRLRLAALTQLLRLRQICCDPRLVEPDASGSILPGTTHPIGAAGSDGPPDDTDGPAVRAWNDADSRHSAGSTKLEAFRELLEETADDGHRLLVFSQFTSLLALLRQELEEQQIAFCYLDGSMQARARQAEVDRFQSSPDVPVFLLSLKAGGTGLNLTGADTIVHYDPWWNPAVEAQATDRAHRIGQTRVVTSYKLICVGSVEEKVLQLQAAKRALLADVFEASEAAASRLSLDDLRGLLR
jgi:superfamily II DNA or RNA helicase